MKHVFLIGLFLFNLLWCSAQKEFILRGELNAMESGDVMLLKMSPEVFYTISPASYSVKLNKGAFVFTGYINKPEQFRLAMSNNDFEYISEPFYIDTGEMIIFIDSLASEFDLSFNGLTVNGLKNSINELYKTSYLKLFSHVNAKINHWFKSRSICETIANLELRKKCIIEGEVSRVAFRKEKDSALFNYSIANPQSQFIAWQLYDFIKAYGYNNLYQNILDSVANYERYDIVAFIDSFLMQKKEQSIGQPFKLSGYINKNLNEERTLMRNNFTLVDFWYSGCRPCIAQFEMLRDVYGQFKRKGFEIVTISTDSKSKIENYKKILKEKKYPWIQLLDLGGKNSSVLSINKYPTNYLVDKFGNIVLIDVHPYVLEKYLTEAL